MKIEKIINLATASTVLCVLSCRSVEHDQVLNSGPAAVNVRMVGTQFSNSKDVSPQASVKKIGALSSGEDAERRSFLINPSTVMVAEMSGVPESKVLRASASAGSRAAIPGDSLGLGTAFRVLAYSASDGTYQTYQDYVVGSPSNPMILNTGTAYNIVAYSYGTSTLPAISSGETTNLSSAVVNYDDNNRDFTYQNVNYTPVNPDNTLNLTLRHRATQINATVNSRGGSGDLNAVNNALLAPHYSDGTIPLSTGNITSRSTLTSGIGLDFTSISNTSQEASSVFINADTGGASTGAFSADITLGGVKQSLSFPIRITPGTQNNLSINFSKCGAYIGPNTNPANFKEFMCQNLGATSGTDPFAAVAANHGAKYQWGAYTGEAGRYYSQSDDQSYSGNISGWISTGKPNGSWSDTSKTANDPCPSGYRVPTSTQWQAVVNNNNVERVGTWADNGNYTTALYFRNPSNVRTLMLPATGFRYNPNGMLYYRGNLGYNWSSSEATSNANVLNFDRSSVFMRSAPRTYGFSVRCVAE